MRKVEVFIEGQRLDLFESESIKLNRSVQDIKDISKIYTDFTQTFTVPASKNNQKIFRHFEIPEIDNGFDTRIKKVGSITINSLDFVTGKIRLEKVQLKENKPTSFSITFFGNLVSLKDVLGEDKLKELTYLDQFDHDYTFANILQGFTEAIQFTVDGVVEDVIRYPMLSPVKRWFYDSSEAVTDDATISNIAFTSTTQPNGINYYELKPALSILWIIKAIEDKYSIKFSGDFFSKPEFKEVQMWLSKDKGYMRSEGNFLLPFADSQVISDKFLSVMVEGPEDNTSVFPNSVVYRLTITPTTNDSYTVILTNHGEPYRELNDLSGEQLIQGALQLSEPNGRQAFQIGFYINSETPVIFDAQLSVDVSDPSSGGTYTQTLLNQSLNGFVRITEQMPDLTIVKFLEGIFKMFNLTVVPNDDTLEVNSLEEWYSKGRIIDVTEHIDTSSLDIEKGTILKQINLIFKEGESFLMSEFRSNFDRGYGDINFILRDEQGNILDGEELTIELPFEQLIYERLTNVANGDRVMVQYGYVTDEEQEPYKLAPHLFYNIKRGIELPYVNIFDSIALKDNTGTATKIVQSNQPSHVGLQDLARYSTTFSADFEEFTGNIISDNLLTNYYLDYLTDLFSVKRRVFSYKAKLPANLTRSLKLNDRLIVKGRRYIINTLDIDLTSSDVNLELINDIYRGETNESLVTKMLLSTYYVNFNNSAASGSFTYQTNEEVNYSTAIEAVDTGDGIGWLSFTRTGNLIEYSITENTTGLDRFVAIKITGFSGSETFFKLKQDA